MGKRKACYLANSWSDYIDQSIQGDMVAGVLNGNWIIPTMEAVTENSGKWRSPPFLRWTAARAMPPMAAAACTSCQLRQC